jgi:hypothetical protein
MRYDAFYRAEPPERLVELVEIYLRSADLGTRITAVEALSEIISTHDESSQVNAAYIFGGPPLIAVIAITTRRLRPHTYPSAPPSSFLIICLG